MPARWRSDCQFSVIDCLAPAGQAPSFVHILLLAAGNPSPVAPSLLASFNGGEAVHYGKIRTSKRMLAFPEPVRTKEALSSRGRRENAGEEHCVRYPWSG
jgi:hypothetical protein